MKLIKIGDQLTKNEIRKKHNKKYADNWEYLLLKEQIVADLRNYDFMVLVDDDLKLIMAYESPVTGAAKPIHIVLPEDLYHQDKHAPSVLHATVVNKEVLYFEKL